MRKTILVVDDDELICTGLQEVLDSFGYHSIAARNGLKAISILEEHPIDLILSDVAMPGMNGYQLYEAVSKRVDWSAIPFLFLSSRTLDSDISFGENLGADGYITKPIDLSELLRKIGQVINKPARKSTEPEVPQASPSAQINLGRLSLSPNQYKAWLDNDLLKLSSREFHLLRILANNPNRVVPMEDLLQASHGIQADSTRTSSLLRPLIRSLRRKLGYGAGDEGCIKNLRGIGYMLIPPPTQE